MRRLTAGALGLALLPLLLGACSDAGTESSAEDNRGPSSTTSTTFDREAEEQAVIDAYLAQLDAFYAAANPPNPDHPALAETATGPLLEGVRTRLAELRDRGVGIRPSPRTVNTPVVMRLTVSAALVEDCNIDAAIQFELATDAVVDDSVAYGRVTARLIKEDGIWVVHSRSVEDLPEQCAS